MGSRGLSESLRSSRRLKYSPSNPYGDFRRVGSGDVGIATTSLLSGALNGGIGTGGGGGSEGKGGRKAHPDLGPL